MSELLLSIDELDKDGAVREAAAAVDTRAGFLKKAGIGAGAVLGGGALLGAFPALAGAAGPGAAAHDVVVLNYALTLEYLEAAFYTEAVAKGALSGETLVFAKTVMDHENQHVQALLATIPKFGGKPVGKPTFDFKGTTADMAKFQATAKVLEDTGVTAYLGQVANIRSKAVLGAAGAILAVEARHAAWITDIIGRGSPLPAPDAFQPAKSSAQVLAAVKATGFITG